MSKLTRKTSMCDATPLEGKEKLKDVSQLPSNSLPYIEQPSAVKTPQWIQETPTPQSCNNILESRAEQRRTVPSDIANPQCKHDVHDLPRLYVHHDVHNQQATES